MKPHQVRRHGIGSAALLGLSVLLLSGAGDARGQAMPDQAQSDVARRFVGVWRYVGTQVDGKPRPNRGANPKGFIFYTASGDMAAQIAPDRENKMAGQEPTPDEAKAALADYVSYFGTYTVDARAGTVTHHRQASVQPGPLTDYVRNYEFTGDRLILRPVGTTQEVVWERIK
jgi:Lipocalin-like domain